MLPGLLTQARILTRVFLGRFFDADAPGGTERRKAALFYLVALLAVPGALAPLLMQGNAPLDQAGWGWSMIARYRGVDVLRVLARGDKTLYLGFAMLASGLVSALCWNNLMPDRREAFILGVLPVRPAVVVAGRLAALVVYVGAITAAIHLLASFSFGYFLAAGSTVGLMLRGVAAHFLAASSASLFVFFGVASAQGLLLTMAGPRLFARLSPLLQAILAGLVILGFVTLPLIGGSVVDTLAGSGPHVRSWVLDTPPVWFLGLYERILGTSDATLLHLARAATLALAGSALATLVTYPLASRRLLTAALGGASADVRVGRLDGIGRWITAAISRRPEVRAVSQFFLTTLARAGQQRLTLAIAVGAGIAWGLPAWGRVVTGPAPSLPRADLLSLPLTLLLLVLVGFRVAALLPASADAAWIFDGSAPSAVAIRSAMTRVMLAVGVVPVAASSAAIYWRWWGPPAALAHAGFTLAIGALVIEALLWRTTEVPCTRPWRPERVNLRARWPLYLFVLLFFSGGLPLIESLLLVRPVGATITCGSLLALAGLVRGANRRRKPAEEIDTVALLAEALRAPGSILPPRQMPSRTAPRAIPATLAERHLRLFEHFRHVRQTERWYDGVLSSPRALGHDLWLAVRRLRRAPGFALFSVATLALGIGAATAAWSIVYALLWAPPPVRDARHLVSIVTEHGAFSGPDLQDFGQQQTAFASLAVTAPVQLRLVGGSIGEVVPGEAVNGAYFGTFGVAPEAGRAIQPADDRPGAPAVALISDSFWRLRLGADPSVLGRTVRIDGAPFEIVGVAPRAFRGWDFRNIERTPVLWIPLSARPGGDETTNADRGLPQFVVKGRLKPGWTIATASAQVAAIGRRLEAVFPSAQTDSSGPASRLGRRWRLEPIRTSARTPLSVAGAALVGAVALVLLIVCSNLANLSLVRGSSRGHDLAVRRALGAPRGRLVREVLFEGALLSIAGGGAALAVARTLMVELAGTVTVGPTRLAFLEPAFGVVAAATAAAVALGFGVFGLWPAVQITRTPARDALSASQVSTPARRSVHRTLVAWQVAGSVALLLVATACLRGIVAYRGHDSGIDVDRLAIATMSFDQNHRDKSQALITVQRILNFARQQPDIQAAAALHSLPFGIGMGQMWYLTPADQAPPSDGTSRVPVQLVAATPGVFDTLGVRILRGRPFDAHDGAGTASVIVISETYARRVFGTEDVIGRAATLWSAVASGGRRTWRPEPVTVIGIATDTDVAGLGNRNGGVIYAPLVQRYQSSIALVVRASGDPGPALVTLRQTIRRAAPDLAIDHAQTAAAMLTPQPALDALAAGSGLLGVFALGLAMTGLYGVLSLVVSSRTRELGVRSTLGADASQLMRLVFADGLRPVGVGLAAGLGAGVLARLALPALFPAAFPVSIDAIDPFAFALIPPALLVAGCLACYAPARRASRVDPSTALRQL